MVLSPGVIWGKLVGVETKYMDIVVNVYNIIHGRDWWKEGRNIGDLGLEGMNVPQIKNYLMTGKKNQIERRKRIC